MSIITWTREAKCKDCKHISLLHYGNRKKFICDKGHGLFKGKNSSICRDDYEGRLEYYIKNKYES